MKIKTVVVSKYPMFREGLNKVLGPEFVVCSHFDDVSELLASKVSADLVILDEETSKELERLKKEQPNAVVLRLGLEDDAGFVVSESMQVTSGDDLLSAVQSVTERLKNALDRKPCGKGYK